ncbi:uncharacterized protein LOC110657013 isoform X2 [Hevea brasiliensis]|uniref:uncharacterized protein LOC110657013 isoform X2 n=1 Tax=Hevea brasiliensis TaxID=3981 RepID=UPI0026007DC8|nr:uncharacterized protein LOC110657013 isoform X2 [Hevea brasiliensis]
MQHHFNSFPSQHSSQIQSNNSTVPVQVFPTNPSLANLCNMLQNSMPIQPQLGIINPQIPIPFNNSNTIMPNMPPLMTQQPGFVNQLGIPQMGFAPQTNMNTIPMFMNQLNPCQPQGQPFAFNFSNLPQQLHHNMVFPNPKTIMQNLNPVVPIQMSNPSQAVGPRNPSSFANPLFVVGQQGNSNQQNFLEDKRTQQVQGSLFTMPQTQNSRPSASFRRQGNPVSDGRNSTSTSNWKSFPGKGFKKNPKKEASKLGYQKSQFHHVNNRKRMFGFSNEHKGKGYRYERATKYGRTNPIEQTMENKRSLALIYTEQEIKQWREERRKNYPSKANIEKKGNERLTNSGVFNKEAKQRREQLKEILAKQAELGVEVAEIPSHYLSDSEKQVNEREDNRMFVTKKGRFLNKRDRRGRYNRNDRLAKQQTLANKDSSNMSSFNERKPTLLQKLLSADIRKDKHHLLQVFRLMVANSFFDDWPEKPLKFPLVVVKEYGREDDEQVAENSSITGKVVNEVRKKTIAENIDHVGADDDDDGDERVEQKTRYAGGKFSLVKEIDKTEEEEGEIID